MKRVLALVYGVLAYVLFLGTFLYAIAFVGNLGVPTTVDSGKPASTLTALVIDALLLGLFAIQHSVMARYGFKRHWTRVVSWYLERSTFVLAASLALAVLLWQWRPIPKTVWDLRGTAIGSVLGGLFWVGWAILLLSTFLIDHFELFGLEQVWAYVKGREFHRPAFKAPLFYQWVRHPIYLGFLIAFWSAPAMTAGHLLFSIATTGYLLVGIYFEERDLVRAYGNAYLDYQRQVPMLIPIGRRYVERSDAPAAVGH
jgi:protein-S-isoprenylcysteine O-methyltransferase Ste14